MIFCFVAMHFTSVNETDTKSVVYSEISNNNFWSIRSVVPCEVCVCRFVLFVVAKTITTFNFEKVKFIY